MTPPARVHWSVGGLVVLLGLVLIAVAVEAIPVAPGKVHAPLWVLGIVGLVCVLAGLLLLPGRLAEFQTPLGAGMITLFAIVLNWIAFGPGERRFGGAIGIGPPSLGSGSGELAGRIMFGIMAVILNVGLVVAWGWWLRELWRGLSGPRR